jgi:membrane protein
MTFSSIGRLLKDAGVKFWKDQAPRLSAALTFYLVLSLSPLLLSIVVIVGFVFGQEAVRGEIAAQIHGVVGQQAATVIEHVLAQTAMSQHGVWSGVIAVIVLLVGASGLFASLQGALNTIWKTSSSTSGSGVLHTVRERALAFALVGGTACLLFISLVISALLTGINARVAGWLPGSALIAEIVNFVVSFALMTTLFAMIFKWLPDAELAWSDVWLGAAVTAGLMILGRYPIGLYLHEVTVGSAFGAAEAFVVFLIWTYYSCQILLFGAELTYVYATHYGRSAVPTMQPSRLAPIQS